MPNASRRLAVRASFLHCLDDPGVSGDAAIEHLEDAWLLVEDGRVASLRAAADDPPPAADETLDLRGRLVVPGFVDTHVHYPQTDVIAAHGNQLLEWLDGHVFPEEARFGDAAHARDTADFFLDELLANGTTTALVFGTVHAASVEAFFEAALERGLRMICGKVMMDRGAPDAVLDTLESSIADTRALIQAWHGRGRLGYAVTPRFAITSSDAQLAAAGDLLREFSSHHGGVHLHTHLAENVAECRAVADLFPAEADYLGVYETHGLVGRRSVFAHAVQLEDDAWRRLGAAGAAVAHCPMSNLFLGSGLFELARADAAGVTVGLGTDVGGGDSFSMLRAVNEAYKVQQLQGKVLSPERAFYLATLGGARALDLDRRIGSFRPGREADFLVLDPGATPLLERRMRAARDWRARLFALMMLGDDRVVEQVFVTGRAAAPRKPATRSAPA